MRRPRPGTRCQGAPRLLRRAYRESTRRKRLGAHSSRSPGAPADKRGVLCGEGRVLRLRKAPPAES
eukprot:2621536-Heterocapsa_arctica.AAC.1